MKYMEGPILNNIMKPQYEKKSKLPNIFFILYVGACFPIYYATENFKHPLLYFVGFIGYSLIPLIFISLYNLKKEERKILRICSIFYIFVYDSVDYSWNDGKAWTFEMKSSYRGFFIAQWLLQNYVI